MEEGGGASRVEVSPASRMEEGGGLRAPVMDASTTPSGCARAPGTDEGEASSQTMASPAGQTTTPSPELSDWASYKLSVTYAPRSYTDVVLGEFTKVSTWCWETNTEKKDSYEQFVRVLHDQWPWSDQESIVFSWWNQSNKFFVLVRSDDSVVNMFDANEDGKHIKILVQFCKKGEEDQLVNTLVEPISPASPFKKREQNPLEDFTQTSQKQLDEYDEENHIGMDEEFTMYSDGEEEDDVATNEAGQHGSSDVEEDSEEEVHERSEEEEEDDETTDEEDSDGAVPEDIPVVHYDKENPSFTKGSLFPSIEEFRVALCTHAVQGEFNYKTIKSDPKRVRVECAGGNVMEILLNFLPTQASL